MQLSACAVAWPADDLNVFPKSSIAKVAIPGVIGVAINHEGMMGDDLANAIEQYEQELGIPVTDPLSGSPARLADMVFEAFPELLEKSLAIA